HFFQQREKRREQNSQDGKQTHSGRNTAQKIRAQTEKGHMTKLVCPDCHHENELERIYCHNCGARLDRSGVIKEKAIAEPAEETQRRIQRLFDTKRGRWRNLTGRLTKTVVGALCLAAVIVMLLPADFPPETKSYDFAPMINMDIVSASSSRRTAPLVYSEA